MSVFRRLLFAALTVAFISFVIEGGARVLWWAIDAYSSSVTRDRGIAAIANERINFLKRPDGVYGYVLPPNLNFHGPNNTNVVTNSQGFAQIDDVAVDRVPDEYRIVAMGESTTQGHNAFDGNYPARLRRLIEENGRRYGKVTVINAGVSGWYSDQLALYAERKLNLYNPDLVLLYAGWNDFQSYDPFRPPSRKSVFEQLYGGTFRIDDGPLVSLTLASALMARLRREYDAVAPGNCAVEEIAASATSEPDMQFSRENLLSGIAFTQWWTARAAFVANRRENASESVHASAMLREDRTGGNNHGALYPVEVRAGHQYVFSLLVRRTTAGAEGRNIALGIEGEKMPVDAMVEFDLGKGCPLESLGVTGQAAVRSVSPGWYRVIVPWTAPDDGKVYLRIQVASPGTGRIYQGDGVGAVEMSDARLDVVEDAATIESMIFPWRASETYHFFLGNLDRVVSAFRAKDPDVPIAVTTLVDRWSEMDETLFLSRLGRVGWMVEHRIDRRIASIALERFNDMLRDYAQNKGLILVDAAHVFEKVDKRPIFDRPGEPGDFVHMFGDSYQMLTSVMYDALRDAGAIQDDVADPSTLPAADRAADESRS